MEELQVAALEGRCGARILRLEGPLELRTISTFQSIARQDNSSPLIVDLSGVTYIDSDGLGSVLGLFVSAQRKQRGFAVAGALADRVRVLFQVTHLGSILPSYATVAEAEASLAKAAGA